LRGNPVELDDQANARPDEIRFVACDPDAGVRLLHFVALDEHEEAVLERGSGSVPPSLDGLRHPPPAPSRIGFNDGGEGGEIETLSVLRLRDCPS